MQVLFEGEKTVVFWIGLVVLGYSVYQFCIAGWQIFYYNIMYYPTMLASISSNTSAATLASMENSLRLQTFQTAVPSIIGGIIFMVIGLYIMKVGIKKNIPQTQS